jgi:hypothetical protein
MRISPAPDVIRPVLAARLRARCSEIESEALSRLRTLAAPEEAVSGPRTLGSKMSVAAAVAYSIEVIEREPGEPPPLPALLLAEARSAAREGMKLQHLVRAYLAGYALFMMFVLEEAERECFVDSKAFRQILREQVNAVDLAVATIGEEHTRAAGSTPRSPRERRATLVARLLAGELLDPRELSYDFDGWNVALVIEGPGAREASDNLLLGRRERHLIVEQPTGEMWIWIACTGRARADTFSQLIEVDGLAGTRVSLGEPARTLAGWRLSHRQAMAALSLPQGMVPSGVIRYCDVAVLISALSDELLATSLHEIYVAPLEGERDGGAVLRGTLRAYFAAQRNVSSAAASLGINRNTLARRLGAAEQLIGRPLGRFGSDIELALRLADRV